MQPVAQLSTEVVKVFQCVLNAARSWALLHAPWYAHSLQSLMGLLLLAHLSSRNRAKERKSESEGEEEKTERE
jgi:hypothetical protein